MPEAKKSKKSKVFKSIFRIVFFVAITAVALYYVLKDNPDPRTTFDMIRNVYFFPLLLAGLVIAGIAFIDGIILTLYAKIYQPKYKYHQGFLNVLLSGFVAPINKAGGQLMKAYTLVKQDVRSEHSASIITMVFIMYQLTLTVYSFAMIFIGYDAVKSIDVFGAVPISYLSWGALFMDAFFLLGLILLAFSHRFHRLLIRIGCDFLSLFKKNRDIEQKKKEWIIKVTTYRIESQRLLQHKGLFAIIFVLGIIKQFLINIVPFLIYWCMRVDVTQLNFMDFLSGSSYLSLITTILPSGAPEVGFQAIFSSMCPLENAASVTAAANLIWRFMTFYLYMIIGAIVYLSYHGSPTRSHFQNTAQTMYDLQVINYETTMLEGKLPAKIKNNDKIEAFTQKDLEISLMRIRRDLELRGKNGEEESDDQMMTLTLQKAQLANVLAEARELQEKQDTQQEAINSVAMDDFKEVNAIQKRRQEAKEARRRRRLERENARALRNLQAQQPEGGTVIVKDDGIEFTNSVEVYKTYPTKDDDEITSDLDDTKKESE